MPSRMPGRSSRSAGATYLDSAERIRQLREAAGRAAENMPEIRRIWLFGSLVRGIPTPRSDADILVEVATSPHACPRDRIPEVLGAMRPVPCPVDLFVATSEELAGHYSGSPVVRLATEAGLRLFG